MISTHEKALHETGRYVRALVACGEGDRVVHVVSLFGHSGTGDSAERTRKNEQLLTDPFQFLAGLCAVPITILVELLGSPIGVGRWADSAALVAEATARAPPATRYVHAGPWSRIDVVLANRICEHALCDAGPVGATGILPVAAVFQLAECEQRVTTIVRMGRSN